MNERAIKTPWSTSKKAIARVTDALPAPTDCCRCNSTNIVIASNSVIYGRDCGAWPWLYLCTSCKSYVGIHPFTAIPLGTLADDKTRQARKSAKVPFLYIIERLKISRNQAYQMLAKGLNIPKNECHFGWFEVQQCADAEKWCNAYITKRGEK